MRLQEKERNWFLDSCIPKILISWHSKDLYEGGRYILPSSDGGRRMFSWDCDGKCFPCRGLWWKAGEVGTEATGYTCCFAFRQDFVPEKELLQSLWEKYWIYRAIFKILTPRINCWKKMWRKNGLYRIIIFFATSEYRIWISFETLPDLVSGKVRWCPLLHCKYLLQGQAMR